MCNSNIIPNYNTAPIIQIAAKVNGGMVSYANLPYMEKPAASMDAAFLPDLDSIASQIVFSQWIGNPFIRKIQESN